MFKKSDIVICDCTAKIVFIWEKNENMNCNNFFQLYREDQHKWKLSAEDQTMIMTFSQREKIIKSNEEKTEETIKKNGTDPLFIG